MTPSQEKLIDEAATNIEGISNLPDGCEPLRAYLRALVSTILRVESQRVDTLRQAAQAVVDRWETPLWKDAPHTATFIHALRDALNPQPESEVKPCAPLQPSSTSQAITPNAVASNVSASNAAPNVPSEGVPPAVSEEDARLAEFDKMTEGFGRTPQPVEPAASETPETDAAVFIVVRAGGTTSIKVVDPDFARDLERRLHSEKERCDQWRSSFTSVTAERDAAIVEVSALRTELEGYKKNERRD